MPKQIGFSRRRHPKLQEQVATMLLITTSVIFASVVAGYAINISVSVADPTVNPQVGQIHDLAGQLTNQTNNLFEPYPFTHSNSTSTNSTATP
jgi:hypothetical protein